MVESKIGNAGCECLSLLNFFFSSEQQLMCCQMLHLEVYNFNKCPIYTHDGTSVKFNTTSDENGLQCSRKIFFIFDMLFSL